jgi:indole-3-glycerol phosphate synthase
VADILDQIVEQTRARIEAQKRRMPRSELDQQMRQTTPRPFARALRRPEGIALIAELQQASPSAGVIRKEPDLPGRIRAYERGGAAALSILTEEAYFHGSPHLLELARKESRLPLLRKDFILDHYQVAESRALGADALLLITTLLEPSLLSELLAHAGEAGLEALVETHDEPDLEKALKAGATLLGINHRNLRTLQVDLSISQRLLRLVPRNGTTVVVESGIRNPGELQRFRELGAHAVLIGETLMRDPDPEKIVRSFVNAASPPSPLPEGEGRAKPRGEANSL